MTSNILKDFNIVDKLYKYRRKFFPSPFRSSAQPANPNMNMLASFVSTKGLSNRTGENNCFLNSAVQVLWHLDSFRKNFNLLSHHACLEDSCIFCALKVIFTQFQFSDEKVLPPDALREALAVAFKDQQRFQLHLMDDAAECFENILTRIHFHLSDGNADDNCTLEHCIPHQKFAMTIIEQVVCETCDATSEPHPFVQLIHYVTARSIISLSQQSQTGFCFSDTLRLAHSDGNPLNKCPSKCNGKARLSRILTNIPDVVSIGLVWDSDHQSAEQVKRFVEAIGTDLDILKMFDRVIDVERAKAVEHKLVGMVCYYGRHYSAFFLHSKSNSWMSCDDATVTDLGPNWQNVVEKCQKGRYQPLLLLYQNPAPLPISTKSAPKKTTYLTQDQSAETELVDFGNSSNSCNSSIQQRTTTYDHVPTVVPSAPSTSPGAERSSETNRSLSAPLMARPAISRATGVGSYHIPANNCVPPSGLQAGAREPFAGNEIQCVPMATSNRLQPHWLPCANPFPQNLLPCQQGAVSAYASNKAPSSYALSSPVGYGTVPQRSLLDLPCVAPLTSPQHPNHLSSQSVVSAPPFPQNFSHYAQNNGVPVPSYTARGVNISVVPVPYSAANLQPFNRDYPNPSNQLDSLSASKWQPAHVLQNPCYNSQMSSDLNPLEWSIIDRDSLLSSPEMPFPNVTSLLVNSGSTSSLYDNLSDFGVDGGMLRQGTSTLTSIPGSPLSTSTSLTESFCFVPNAKSFDSFTGNKDFKDLVMEADQLMLQSEEKERSGDLQAALICCNQANSLYAMSQRQLFNAEFSVLNNEVELKRVKSYNRSMLLSTQIEINQQKSKSNVQKKSPDKIVSNQLLRSEALDGTNQAPTHGDLIFLDEPKPPNSKYQGLKDRLPQLYTQNYVGCLNLVVHK